MAAVGRQACGKEIPLTILTLVLLGAAITLVMKANQDLMKNSTDIMIRKDIVLFAPSGFGGTAGRRKEY